MEQQSPRFSGRRGNQQQLIPSLIQKEHQSSPECRFAGLLCDLGMALLSKMNHIINSYRTDACEKKYFNIKIVSTCLKGVVMKPIEEVIDDLQCSAVL